MLKEKIDQYLNQHEQELVEAASRLIAVPSVRGEPLPGMPFGEGPAKALELALQMARDYGFATANFDNYVGTADINEHETRLGILCHLDVVGEGIGWSTAPYSAVVKDGLLYGRGSSDNKGPAVASLFALKAVKDLGIPLKYNARLILGTDEESGSSDIRYYFERQKAPPNTFSPDGVFPVTNIEKGGMRGTVSKTWAESQSLPRITAVKGGYRGNVVPPQADAWVQGLSEKELRPYCDKAEERTGASFTLTEENGTVKIATVGKSEHASTPEKGINAITALLDLLSSLPAAESESFAAVQALNRLFPHGDFYGQALGIAQSDDISGQLTLSLNIFELTLTGCSGNFDSRTPLCTTKASSEDIVRGKLAEYGFQFECRSFPGHYTPSDSIFVKTLLAAYEQYTGLEGQCEYTGGGTYVHNIEGGVCFGAILPDFEPNMHGADERVRIQDLITAAKIFAQVIVDICG